MKTGDFTLLVGFRIHIDQDEQLIQFYIDNCLNWLKYRGHEILQCVTGYHNDTGNGHIHIHLITKGHKWANPIQTFKSDYKTNKLGLIYNNKKGLKELPKDILGIKYRNRLNISIKMTERNDETDGIRFLQYPLKEGRPYYTYGVTLAEVEELTKVAKIEYAQAKAKRIEHLSKEEVRLTEWDTILEMVRKQQFGSVEAVFSYVCEIYKARESKPPSIRSIVDFSERISFKLGILSIEGLTNRYFR